MAKLYFKYGAMGCGKSTALLQAANNYEEKGGDVLILKPSIDTKGDDRVVSRLGINRSARLLEPDESVWNHMPEFNDYSVILVDESQFLSKEQVDELHDIAMVHDIPVLCYGLRTNYRLEDGGFDGATRLLQVADELEEIKTVCKCGRKATCNARYVDKIFTRAGSDILIDGTDAKVEYKSLCYRCYSLEDAMFNEPHSNWSHLDITNK